MKFMWKTVEYIHILAEVGLSESYDSMNLNERWLKWRQMQNRRVPQNIQCTAHYDNNLYKNMDELRKQVHNQPFTMSTYRVRSFRRAIHGQTSITCRTSPCPLCHDSSTSCRRNTLPGFWWDLVPLINTADTLEYHILNLHCLNSQMTLKNNVEMPVLL